MLAGKEDTNRMSVISATILLFVVIDPFGNVPLFLGVLDAVPVERRRTVLARELLIALLILVAVLFAGPHFLSALQISQPSLRIAGGIILVLIAIKMVFGGTGKMFKETPEGEPLIVPLAVPYVAGPSATATVLLLAGQEPTRWPAWLLSVFLAWMAAAAILLSSTKLAFLLGKRGLCAIERLMGLILTAVAVEMFLGGLRAFLGSQL
jgi:multiple antibiotic resistance protein